eukprot:5945235-Pyramimonas_sp.AAC.1
MTDASMLPALVKALQSVDLNHPSAPKIVNSILKPMEVLTRVLTASDAAGAAARRGHGHDRRH